MKKLILLCMLCTVLAASLLPIQATVAADNNAASLVAADTAVTVLENGDYIVETLTFRRVASRAASSVETIYATKDAEYFTEDGEAVLRFTLEAFFEVNTGVSATCVDTSYSYSIYDSAWKRDSISTWGEGSFAYGNAVFKHKVLFVTVSTANIDLRIACDRYGNLY